MYHSSGLPEWFSQGAGDAGRRVRSKFLFAQSVTFSASFIDDGSPEYRCRSTSPQISFSNG